MHVVLQSKNVEQIQIVKISYVNILQNQHVSIISDVIVYRNLWFFFRGPDLFVMGWSERVVWWWCTRLCWVVGGAAAL
ncbi:hypothetical protein P8452_69559 [Trifolium repens]|nr:hypothetical protein P8452_69559 [Trifolium repens]